MKYETVKNYYAKRESRVGYRLLLGGRRHFGYDKPGSICWPWRFGESQDRLEDQLISELRLGDRALVLDAGCGEGEVARRVASSTGASVVGIDPLEQSVEIATARSERSPNDRVTFEIGDYHDLQFDDSSFDAVYTMETLVHSSDVSQALREIFRVLKPGGVLVTVEYASVAESRADPSEYHHLLRVCKLGAMPGWIQLTFGRMAEIAESVGFDLQRQVDLTPNMFPMLKTFAAVAFVPYSILKAVRSESRAVNAMSAHELSRRPELWRYEMHHFRKPSDGKPEEHRL